MSFLAPALPYLIPAAIQGIGSLLGGDKKEVEYKSTATAEDQALRNQIIQMIMGQANQWKQPTLGQSGQAGMNTLLQKMFGQGAGINYGTQASTPTQTPQMSPGGLPGGMSGGMPGNMPGGMNPWQMFQNRQMPR